MPNTHFHFKKFTIHQDKCAMKVGTDGVLLGAWVEVDEARKILDIGTGTGLIAIMLAQRTKFAAEIDAVEIDQNAFDQAEFNVFNCTWNRKIALHHIAFQDFAEQTLRRYDLIVSNPPYFSNSLKSATLEKNLARHNDSLPFKDLITSAAKIMRDDGRFCVILPAESATDFIKLAEKSGMFCNIKTLVKPNPQKAPKRVLLEFSRTKMQLSDTVLTIESHKRHVYTDEFKELTKDFYLGYANVDET